MHSDMNDCFSGQVMRSKLRKFFRRPVTHTEYRIVNGKRIGGRVCKGPEFEEAARLYHEGRGDAWTGYDWWFQPKIVQSRKVTEWVDTDKPAYPDGTGKYYP